MRTALLLTTLCVPQIQAQSKPTTASPASTDTRAAAPSCRAMSFNIRYANPRDGLDHWSYRADLVASVLRFHRIDICGIQEALGDQMDTLHRKLPSFDSVATGRDGRAGGERCAIFYRRERYRLIQSATFWLSPTPDRPTAAWGARLRRIVTWAELEDRAHSKRLFVFNTHFDHRSANARRNSAALLLDKIDEIATARPVVVLGDLNCTPTSEPYRLLISGGDPAKPAATRALRDGFWESERGSYGPSGTFTGFGGVAKPGPRIDYVFVRGPVQVIEHGILADSWDNARTPSDHRPVLAELRIGSRTPRRSIMLNHGWRFATDPRGHGEREGWHTERFDDSEWRFANAGEAWERQGAENYDGVAFYRRTVELPSHWSKRPVRFVLDGVADQFAIYLNGHRVLALEDADSYWQRRVVVDIPTELLRFGSPNTIAIAVRDTGGFGGLIGRPVMLTVRDERATHRATAERR